MIKNIKHFFGGMTLRKVIAMAMVLCMTLSLCACNKDDPNATTTAPGEITYSIEVRAESGMALENVGVYIYADSTLQDMVWGTKTDAQGKATFTGKSGDYVAVLKDCPEGFEVAETYPLAGETTKITLSSAVISDTDLTGVTYKLGDVIRDFTVTTPDGTAYTLSELLEEKKAVVLNFWYTGCVPCRMEFPYMQEAYEKYSDDIALLAIDPVEADDDIIAAFQSSMELTIPMAQGDPLWQDAFNLVYPTTVVVDRYGMITLIQKGTVPSTETFEAVFAYFSADDYEQAFFNGIGDFAVESPVTDPTDSTEPSTETTDPNETTVPPTETTAPSGNSGSSGGSSSGGSSTGNSGSSGGSSSGGNSGSSGGSSSGSSGGTTEPSTGPKPYNQGEPISIGGTLQFDAEVPAGYYVYYNIYKVSGTYLRIESGDAYVTYNGKTYYPENGVVTFPVSSEGPSVPIQLQIGNSGTKDTTFHVTFAYPQGHMMNPINMTLGSFTVNVAEGNDQGVFYSFKQTGAGTLTMTIDGVTVYDEGKIVVTVTNSRGIPVQYDVQGGSGATLSVPIKSGDSVSINICGVSPDFSLKACTVQVTASFG